MSHPTEPGRAPLLTARQVRQLIGVLLTVLGVGGVVTVVFVASTLAGAGLSFGLAAVAGFALAYER